MNMEAMFAKQVHGTGGRTPKEETSVVLGRNGEQQPANDSNYGSQESAAGVAETNKRVTIEHVRREQELTLAIQRYADVFEELVNRSLTVLEIQLRRTQNGLDTGTSANRVQDEANVGRIRHELEGVRAFKKAMENMAKG